MQKYDPISVLVNSGNKWRVFTTESFTIRPIVNHLQRYNADFNIRKVRYGYFPTEILPNNTSWTKMTLYEVNDMFDVIDEDTNFDTIPSVPDLKKHLLENYDYRTALSMWYIHCANSHIYPSKSVFRGVKVSDIPDWLITQTGRCQRPCFVSDKDNPYTNVWDILKYYDGRRIDRMINGQKVSGYLLDSMRITNGESDTYGV